MQHLKRDLEHLKREILSVGALVEKATNKAITALIHKRTDLADEVLRGDEQIDQREVAIEEECLKILALHQPVAVDLRFIVSVLKVNNDLERIGDLAVNIAERAAYLSTHESLEVPLDFPEMAETVRKMLRLGLDALVNLDTSLAHEVCGMDDRVDAINAQMFGALQRLMANDPGTIKRAIHTLSASRHLERIADLVTNIAEDVVFMVDGEVVRHRFENYWAEEHQPSSN